MTKGTASRGRTTSSEDKAEPAKKTAAKKTAAKKATPAKKPAARSSNKKGASKLKPGDQLLVKVDPRGNNGSDMAAAVVTRGLNVEEGEAANVTVFVDGDRPRSLRNVPVLSKAPGAKDKDVPTVYALRP